MFRKLKAWWSRPSYQKLREQNEQFRVQLAGCSVAAFGYAKDNNDCKPGDYGHSVSFDDVKNLYNRWRALRLAIDWIARDSAPGDCAHDHADAYVKKAREARLDDRSQQGISAELGAMLDDETVVARAV